jgi:hypothetical protein
MHLRIGGAAAGGDLAAGTVDRLLHVRRPAVQGAGQIDATHMRGITRGSRAARAT